MKQGFEDYGFGETTWVEWCGNVHFPAIAGKSQSDYTSYFGRWTKLQLPYTYGSLNRIFGNNKYSFSIDKRKTHAIFIKYRKC